VSEEPENTQAPAAEAPKQEPPKLRRRPFGVRKADVLAALEHRDTELGAREAELAELRQDIAALWLAFAQHDRMIRRALGQDDSPAETTTSPTPETDAATATRQAQARPEAPAPSAPGGGAAPAEPKPASPGPEQTIDPAQASAAADAAIGRQLSDLDDVLAAIELATQTLERTYVSDPAQGGTAAPQQGPSAGSDAAA
jgi:hypothetical protein